MKKHFDINALRFNRWLIVWKIPGVDYYVFYFPVLLKDPVSIKIMKESCENRGLWIAFGLVKK
jgi:hypothetical protein